MCKVLPTTMIFLCNCHNPTRSAQVPHRKPLKFDLARRDGLDLGPDILWAGNIFVDYFEGFQIHPDSTGYDWTEEAPILSSLVRWSVLLVHQKSKSSVDCRGCHLFLLQDEALDSQDVILQFKVARKWKITEAGQCKCMHCTTFLENSLLTQTDPNRSSLTVFNMFQRFSLRPMRSFVRCFRVAWLLLNNWYKPQVRAAGRGRGDALTVSENRHERWSTRPTS